MENGYEYGEIEMYDFISTKNGTESISMITDNGWKIELDSMGKGIDGTKFAICNYYSPARQFFRIWRVFRENGMISRRGAFMSRIPFDIFEEFDENGKLIKYFDSNAKFGRISRLHIVHILEKEGWFNRETGEQKIIPNIERLPTNGEFTQRLFSPRRMLIRHVSKEQLWKVTINLHNGPSTIPIFYTIDGNTGEFTKEVGKETIRRRL